MTTTPAEAAARTRKAIALALVLKGHGATSDQVKALTNEQWATIAELAQVRPPSPETAAVVEVLLDSPGIGEPVRMVCANNVEQNDSDEDDDETTECPEHGTQRIVDYSATRGADPYNIEVLACGHGVACFGPGEENVIISTDRRQVERTDVEALTTEGRSYYDEARRCGATHGDALDAARSMAR